MHATHQTLQAPIANTTSPSVHRLLERLESIYTDLKFRLQRQHQRQQLAELSDERLDDIGISREQAQRESQKTFWQD